VSKNWICITFLFHLWWAADTIQTYYSKLNIWVEVLQFHCCCYGFPKFCSQSARKHFWHNKTLNMHLHSCISWHYCPTYVTGSLGEQEICVTRRGRYSTVMWTSHAIYISQRLKLGEGKLLWVWILKCKRSSTEVGQNCCVNGICWCASHKLLRKQNCEFSWCKYGKTIVAV
jgi:hypothetical protein